METWRRRSIDTFLREIGLAEYIETFKLQGFSSLYYILVQMMSERWQLNDTYLKEKLLINKLAH